MQASITYLPSSQSILVPASEHAGPSRPSTRQSENASTHQNGDVLAQGPQLTDASPTQQLPKANEQSIAVRLSPEDVVISPDIFEWRGPPNPASSRSIGVHQRKDKLPAEDPVNVGILSLEQASNLFNL